MKFLTAHLETEESYLSSLALIETLLEDSKEETAALRAEIEILSPPIVEFFESCITDENVPEEFPEEIAYLARKWFHLGDVIFSFMNETYASVLNK